MMSKEGDRGQKAQNGKDVKLVQRKGAVVDGLLTGKWSEKG